MENTFKIRVKIGDRESELSYPLSERGSVEYPESTLGCSVRAIKDLVEILKSE